MTDIISICRAEILGDGGITLRLIYPTPECRLHSLMWSGAPRLYPPTHALAKSLCGSVFVCRRTLVFLR